MAAICQGCHTVNIFCQDKYATITVSIKWEIRYNRRQKPLKLYTHGVNSFEAKWRIYASVNSTGSDNGLAPQRRQAIIWTNAGIVN